MNEADNSLNNGNYNAVANDYWGGNSGVYSNTVLGQTGYAQGLATQYGYSPATDPETSGQFGNWPSSGAINTAPQHPQRHLCHPNDSSAAFSVEAWVNGGAQTYDAGIVTIGYGGAEQINLDTGSTSAAPPVPLLLPRRQQRHPRLEHSIAPDGKWHHLVGVAG